MVAGHCSSLMSLPTLTPLKTEMLPPELPRCDHFLNLTSQMLASLFTTLLSLGGFILISSPFALIITAFQLWMFIHAIRQREYVWAVLILVGWGLAALW